MTIEQALKDLNGLKWDNCRAREIASEVMCHSRMDKSCAKLLLKQHPSEDPSVFKWRLENFAHITYPLFLKCKNAISKIFQTTDHSYTASVDTMNYLKSARFGFLKGLSFDEFIQQYCLQAMIEDPNAWLIIMPNFPVPPANESVDINMKIIWSKNQLFADDDLIIFSDSPCTSINKHTESGVAIDKERIVTFVNNNGYYAIRNEWYHGLGEIPYCILGGNMTTDDVFTSFFQPFIEYANQALMFYSEWQVTKGSCAFPIKEMDEIQCKTCHGTMRVDNQPCGSCKGTGFETSFSPATVFIRRKVNMGEPERMRPMLEFISPPVDIIQEQKADWELMLKKSAEALNMVFVSEAESGIAKDIDRSEFYAFLQMIAAMLFGNIEYTALNCIERMRRYNRAEPVTVVKPTSYTIETKTDLMQDLLDAQKTNSDVLRADRMRRLQKHINQNDPVAIKINDFLIEFDYLYLLTITEIIMLVDAGIATQDEASTNRLAYSELLKLIDEKNKQPTEEINYNWFLDPNIDYDTIATELNARIAPILARKEQNPEVLLPAQ